MENRFVRKLGGFADLTQEDVDALLAITSVSASVAARIDLVRDGDPPAPFFIVLDGWACRYKILPNGARQVLGYLVPGDACDLHAALLEEVDHGIQTITTAKVVAIDRAELDSILSRRPAIAKAMHVSQQVDLGTMRAWITSMGRRTSIERVAHLACELYLRACNVGLAGGPDFALPLSQLLLADTLGMTPVHLNRVIQVLRLNGSMTFRRGSVIITDPAKLRQIAGFEGSYLHHRRRDVARPASAVRGL